MPKEKDSLNPKKRENSKGTEIERNVEMEMKSTSNQTTAGFGLPRNPTKWKKYCNQKLQKSGERERKRKEGKTRGANAMY